MGRPASRPPPALSSKTGAKSEESKQEKDPAVLIENLLRRFLAQAKDGKELSVQGYSEEYRGLEIKVSFGKGNLARIPWIAFLGEGQAVSNGIYPVLLLFRQEICFCFATASAKRTRPRNHGRFRRDVDGPCMV